jgi:hypothetical protein
MTSFGPIYNIDSPYGRIEETYKHFILPPLSAKRASVPVVLNEKPVIILSPRILSGAKRDKN